MKKLILPLLLLVAFGMLAAVESDPSNIVGYVKYGLTGAKNNMIALPMVQSYTLASEVGNAITGCNAVRWYDPALPGWRSATKNPVTGVWSNNFAVTNGQGLQVYTTTTGNFYSIGDLPATMPTYTLVGAKNNVIMVPLNRSDLNMAGLVGNSIPGCNAVRWYDPTLPGWRSATKNPVTGVWSNNFATEIGDPLQVYTTTGQTWPSAKLSK